MLRNLGALTLLVCLLSSTAALSDNTRRPAIIAVKLHADWCGSCQKMGPAMTHLANKLDTQPILFVTLDRTTRSSRQQSDFMAVALGIDRALDQFEGKTGAIVVLDARTKRVVETLGAGQCVKQMGKRLKRAVGQVGEARR